MRASATTSPAPIRTATGATARTTRRCSAPASRPTCSTTSPAPAAHPWHLIEGGQHQWNELNQGDALAIKARNTHIKLIWIVVGANGDGTIQFGPVATDCAVTPGPVPGRVLADLHRPVDGAHRRQPAAASRQALTSVKQTMTRAGYLRTRLRAGAACRTRARARPDVEDNPNFPGWYAGGCVLYLADMAFARNKAVPLFETALRQAAAQPGRPLPRRQPALPRPRGVHRQHLRARALHRGRHLGRERGPAVVPPQLPGARHVRPVHDRLLRLRACQRATCVDPASTGQGVLFNGLMEFKQLRNAATGSCVDGKGYDSRNDTVQQTYACHGGRNQGFWYDPARAVAALRALPRPLPGRRRAGRSPTAPR